MPYLDSKRGLNSSASQQKIFFYRVISIKKVPAARYWQSTCMTCNIRPLQEERVSSLNTHVHLLSSPSSIWNGFVINEKAELKNVTFISYLWNSALKQSDVCFIAAVIRGLHIQNLNIDHLTNVFGGHSLNWFHPHIWALFKRYLWMVVSSLAPFKRGRVMQMNSISLCFV